MENFNMSKDHECLQHSQNYVNINNIPVQFSKKNVCFVLSCHSMLTEKVIKNVDKISSKKPCFEYSKAELFLLEVLLWSLKISQGT